MTREELAKILFDAYQRTPDQCFPAMADAAIEAMKPTTIDDERRKLWREAFLMVLRHEYAIRADYTDMGYVAGIAASRAQVFADAALAADAEKWGAK